jgi:hypothetical protein
VIIGEYSPRRSRGEYSRIITEPEANHCFSICTQAFVYFETEFILISLIYLLINVHKTGSRHFEYFCFVIFTGRWIYQIITSNLTNQRVRFLMFTSMQNTNMGCQGMYIYVTKTTSCFAKLIKSLCLLNTTAFQNHYFFLCCLHLLLKVPVTNNSYFFS